MTYFAGSGARDQHWHPLAGMIGAFPSRVVAVIGGEDRQIAGAEGGQKSGQAGVEPFQRPGVSRHVTSVAIHGIEFDKIRERQRRVGSGIGPDPQAL